VTVRFLEGASDYSLLCIIQTSSGAYPFSFQWISWAVFPEVKQLIREADQSCPSSVGAENEQRCTSIPHTYTFMARTGIALPFYHISWQWWHMVLNCLFLLVLHRSYHRKN